MVDKNKTVYEQSLAYHKLDGKPGKVSLKPTKPLDSQADLALAYSPGVAQPCREIHKDPNAIYEYTSKGNTVAVISNGTAILGLGNLGPAASKPVMEGKSVLFKVFANIDSVDVEVNETDPQKIIDHVVAIGDTYGGINLEDIKAPECFEIEKAVQAKLDIPVFHDDQHGTAIVTVAGLVNAFKITNRKPQDVKVVINGSGAAGIACLELVKTMGVKPENIYLCDSHGLITIDREFTEDDIKAKYAIKTEAKTLSDALKDADVFLGLSVAGVVSKEMVKTMKKEPIIFAMANPEPEIKPEDVLEVAPDAIVATGRSDYPNQINNVMAFPFIFRGALDVRSKKINEEMKLAAAKAIAEIANESVPAVVTKAYPGKKLIFGKNYIVPTPFDPRLMARVSMGVAKAAIESGVARIQIENWKDYQRELESYKNPSMSTINIYMKNLVNKGKKVIFADGEEQRIIETAFKLANENLASPILVGREEIIKKEAEKLGITDFDGVRIHNALLAGEKNEEYTDYLFKKLQRSGFLRRDCERLIKTDRNFFAGAVLALGEADCMVSGYSRSYSTTLEEALTVIDQKEEEVVMDMSIVVSNGKTIFIANPSTDEEIDSFELAQMANQAAEHVKSFGIEPRVAFVSGSNFGSKVSEQNDAIQEAVEILEETGADFEFDGEMTPSTALSKNPREYYPFNRLSKPANILIMPDVASAAITVSMLKELSESTVIGPVLLGLEKSVQILKLNASAEHIFDMAVIAAVESDTNE